MRVVCLITDSLPTAKSMVDQVVVSRKNCIKSSDQIWRNVMCPRPVSRIVFALILLTLLLCDRVQFEGQAYHYNDRPVMIVFVVLEENFAKFMFDIPLWLRGRAAVSEMSREPETLFRDTESNMTFTSN